MDSTGHALYCDMFSFLTIFSPEDTLKIAAQSKLQNEKVIQNKN